MEPNELIDLKQYRKDTYKTLADLITSREIFKLLDIPNHKVFMISVVGSYNADEVTLESDIDIRVITLDRISDVTSFKDGGKCNKHFMGEWETSNSEKLKVDVQVMAMKDFLELVIKSNPNALEIATSSIYIIRKNRLKDVVREYFDEDKFIYILESIVRNLDKCKDKSVDDKRLFEKYSRWLTAAKLLSYNDGLLVDTLLKGKFWTMLKDNPYHLLKSPSDITFTGAINPEKKNYPDEYYEVVEEFYQDSLDF